MKHITQKTSWRALAREFGVDHISLYKFYEHAKETQLLEEIFHVFLDSRSSLYIGDLKHFDIRSLDNSEEIFRLTREAFENMLRGL